MFNIRLNRNSIASRHRQSWEDIVRHRVGDPRPGGYPVNPSESEAYAAGFNRGYYAATQEAIRKGYRPDNKTEAPDDSTFAAQGELDGWNDVVNKLK